jgi:hypothetical protein
MPGPARDDPDPAGTAPWTPVERLLERNLVDDAGFGKPLSHRAATTQRTVEAYLKSGVKPRWMERVIEIDQGIASVRRRLEREYRTLWRACLFDAERFADRWRERVAELRFDDLNELIEQHNEWYPVERRLPMNPRTGDYVPVGGRSYRRPVLGPDWVLEHFPPEPPQR